MITSNSLGQSNSLTDHAAQSADHAIKSTQRFANDALDGLSGSVKDIRDQAAPMLNRATEQASALAHRGQTPFAKARANCARRPCTRPTPQ